MKVELMSPAGSYEALMSAIQAGCDSVYFGIEQLNMRARSSNNFTLEDLKKIAAIGKEQQVKMYLTLNTILYQHDMNLMKTIVRAAKRDGRCTLVGAKEKRGFYTVNLPDFEKEENELAAKNCPVNIIWVKEL
jgi:putative protease